MMLNTDMILSEINDLSNIRLVNILSKGLSDIDDEIRENYSPQFKENPANLFHILEKGRFLTGKYYILSLGDRYIASAGWNMYDEDTALLMTRSYTIKEYRTQFLLGKIILPRMIEEVKKIKNVWITFNSYNKGFYDWISRGAKGDTTYWPESWHKFRPIGLKEIYYTQQHVIELIK